MSGRKYVGAIAVACVLALPMRSLAFPDGVSGRSASGCGGAACHGSAATSSVSVSISGSSTLLPNQIGNYTLTIAQGGAGGAFDVAISGGGTLGENAANTQIVRGDFTHVNAADTAPLGNRGQWVYDFTVTAPGTIGAQLTLAAVGMQFNTNGSNDAGDLWNNATPFAVTVVPEPTTMSLLGLGLIGLALRRNRRR